MFESDGCISVAVNRLDSSSSAEEPSGERHGDSHAILCQRRFASILQIQILHGKSIAADMADDDMDPVDARTPGASRVDLLEPSIGAGVG
jgi:hypothetical protein